MTWHYKGLCAYQYNSLLQVIIKVSIPNSYIAMFRILNSITFCFVKHIIKITFLAFFLFFLRLLPWKRTHKIPREAQKFLLRMFYFYLTKIWLIHFFEAEFNLHMTSFRFSSSLEGNHRVQMPSYERSPPFSFFLN